MPRLRPTPPQLDAYDRTFPTPNARPAIQPGIRLHPGRALRVVTYAASPRGETPGETANWERAIAGSSAPQCSRGQNFFLLSEREARRLRKSRQQRSRGIENRPAADILPDGAIEHRLGSRRATKYADQASAVLELSR